jgi:hypothetical protein
MSRELDFGRSEVLVLGFMGQLTWQRLQRHEEIPNAKIQMSNEFQISQFQKRLFFLNASDFL